jgi:hypothetical protein
MCITNDAKHKDTCEVMCGEGTNYLSIFSRRYPLCGQVLSPDTQKYIAKIKLVRLRCLQSYCVDWNG